MYSQLEDEDHFGGRLEDLVKGHESRTVGGGVQHRDLVQGLGPQLLGASSLPQELGRPLLTARPLPASPHRGVLAPVNQAQITKLVVTVSLRVSKVSK